MIPPALSQRQLTDMAVERLAEMLHWRTAADLDFAIAIWPRDGGGKITVAVSSNDTELVMKLHALIVEHKGG